MIKRFFFLGFLTSNQFIHIHKIAIRGNNRIKIIFSDIHFLSLNFSDKGSSLSIASVNNLILVWPYNNYKTKLIIFQKLSFSYYFCIYHIIIIRIYIIFHWNISSVSCLRTFLDDTTLHFTIQIHN